MNIDMFVCKYTFTNQNLEKRRVRLKTRGFHVKPGVFKTRKIQWVSTGKIWV